MVSNDGGTNSDSGTSEAKPLIVNETKVIRASGDINQVYSRWLGTLSGDFEVLNEEKDVTGSAVFMNFHLTVLGQM